MMDASRAILKPRGFWFLRHGQTDWNAERRSQGRTDIPLNDRGREQARLAGEILAQKFAGGKRPFTKIVSSPLKRAAETAEIVRDVIHAANGPKLAITYDPDLREVSFGVEEGKPLGEWYHAWIEGGPAPKDGESFQDLEKRAVQALNRAHPEHKDEEALIVGHGALFRAVRNAMNLPIDTRLGNAIPLEALPPEESGQPWILRTETEKPSA